MGILLLAKSNLYTLLVPRFHAALLFSGALLFSAVSPTSASAKEELKRYSSCSQLRKVWSTGVATSVAKARLQAVRPAVNAAGYLKNRHLDNDRDGTACEVAKSPIQVQPTWSTPVSTSPPLPPITTSTTTTTLLVRCPVFGDNVGLEIAQSSSLSESRSGQSSYRVSREYYLRVTNSSSSTIVLSFANLKSTYNGNQELTFSADLTGIEVAAGSEINRRFTYQQVVSPTVSPGNGLYNWVISTVGVSFVPMLSKCR